MGKRTMDKMQTKTRLKTVRQPESAPNDNANDGDNLSSLDHSVLREPINLGIKNVMEIITCISDGSREVKDLILNECNLIYECRACRNLFRSLANFLAHKRLYCQTHCCKEMVLYDPNWLEKVPIVRNEQEPEKIDTESNQTPSTSQSNQAVINPEPESEPILAPKRSLCNVIDDEQKMIKKKRLESLLGGLQNSSPSATIFAVAAGSDSQNSETECRKTFSRNINFKCIPCNISCRYFQTTIRHMMNNHQMSREQSKTKIISLIEKASGQADSLIEFEGEHLHPTDKRKNSVNNDSNIENNEDNNNITNNKDQETVENIEATVKSTNEDSSNIENINCNNDSSSPNSVESCTSSNNGLNNIGYQIDFVCVTCKIRCSYMQTAIRHLVKRHNISREKAKEDLISLVNKDPEQRVSMIKDKDKDSLLDEIINNKSIRKKIDSHSSNNTDAMIFYDEPPQIPKPSSSTKSIQASAEKNDNQSASSTKRYDTRCLSRKKWIYDCNSPSCLYSKHCTCSNNQETNQNSQNRQDNKKQKKMETETKASDAAEPRLETANEPSNKVTESKLKITQEVKKIVINPNDKTTKFFSLKSHRLLLANGTGLELSPFGALPKIEFIKSIKVKEPKNPSQTATTNQSVKADSKDKHEIKTQTDSADGNGAPEIILIDDDDNDNSSYAPLTLLSRFSASASLPDSQTQTLSLKNQSDKDNKDADAGLKIHLRRPTTAGTSGSKPCYEIVNSGTVQLNQTE